MANQYGLFSMPLPVRIFLLLRFILSSLGISFQSNQGYIKRYLNYKHCRESFALFSNFQLSFYYVSNKYIKYYLNHQHCSKSFACISNFLKHHFTTFKWRAIIQGTVGIKSLFIYPTIIVIIFYDVYKQSTMMVLCKHSSTLDSSYALKVECNYINLEWIMSCNLSDL